MDRFRIVERGEDDVWVPELQQLLPRPFERVFWQGQDEPSRESVEDSVLFTAKELTLQQREAFVLLGRLSFPRGWKDLYTVEADTAYPDWIDENGVLKLS